MKPKTGIDKQEQFTLRLRKGSQVDTIMRTMLSENRGFTKQEIIDLGDGQKQWGWNYAWMLKFFDNVSITTQNNKYKVAYFDLHPSAPIPVSVSVDVQERSPKPSPKYEVEGSELDYTGLPDDLFEAPKIGAQEFISNVRWPDCPPLVESQDFFREPTWYKTMRAMVRLGKHIALSGPPGVGKDTAVIELAASEGHPLITIGGDAGFRRRDLVGTAHIANGSSYFETAEYAAAVVNGWWVLLTEVNAADADALMFINAQLAAPYIVTVAGKAYPVHPDFRLFVSYNPGLIGTKPLPQSFKDRFYSIQVPFFTEAFLKSILIAHGMPDNDEEWPRAILHYAMALWDAYERGQLRYQITSRRLIDAVTLMNEHLTETVREALKLAVVAAIDSPVESKVADRVLTEVMNQNLYT